MEPHKLVEDFSHHFLHLYYEILAQILNFNLLREEFKCLVHVSQYGEPPNYPSSPTLVDHGAPHIIEEKANIPFSPCPTPFSVPMWVPPCGDCKVEESALHVPSPYSHPSPTSMEEISEWLKKPITKTHSSIPQKDVTIHESSLESNPHLFNPP